MRILPLLLVLSVLLLGGCASKDYGTAAAAAPPPPSYQGGAGCGVYAPATNAVVPVMVPELNNDDLAA